MAIAWKPARLNCSRVNGERPSAVGCSRLFRLVGRDVVNQKQSTRIERVEHRAHKGIVGTQLYLLAPVGLASGLA